MNLSRLELLVWSMSTATMSDEFVELVKEIREELTEIKEMAKARDETIENVYFTTDCNVYDCLNRHTYDLYGSTRRKVEDSLVEFEEEMTRPEIMKLVDKMYIKNFKERARTYNTHVGRECFHGLSYYTERMLREGSETLCDLWQDNQLMLHNNDDGTFKY